MLSLLLVQTLLYLGEKSLCIMHAVFENVYKTSIKSQVSTETCNISNTHISVFSGPFKELTFSECPQNRRSQTERGPLRIAGCLENQQLPQFIPRIRALMKSLLCESSLCSTPLFGHFYLCLWLHSSQSLFCLIRAI